MFIANRPKYSQSVAPCSIEVGFIISKKIHLAVPVLYLWYRITSSCGSTNIFIFYFRLYRFNFSPVEAGVTGQLPDQYIDGPLLHFSLRIVRYVSLKGRRVRKEPIPLQGWGFLVEELVISYAIGGIPFFHINPCSRADLVPFTNHHLLWTNRDKHFTRTLYTHFIHTIRHNRFNFLKFR